MKKLLISCLVMSVCLGIYPGVSSSARAAFVADCTVSGYTFMGGGMGYREKNNFTIGAKDESQMWGYAWLKFDNLPTDPVGSAILSLEELYYQAGGMGGPPSAENPMDVGVYAVSADVTGIDGTYTLSEFKNHIASVPADTITISAPSGYYHWDITEMVNGWITGDNYGLVVSGIDSGYMLQAKFAAFPQGVYTEVLGMAPVVADVAIPEPATLVLLGLGGLFGFTRRGRKA